MNQKSLELWKHRIADKKASGLNVTDWCVKNNLTKHAYYYWMKRIEATEQMTDASVPVFVEIEPAYITPRKIVKLDIQVTRNDINLTISDSDTAKLAAEFIRQLQFLC
jgi:hypothetical protein